MSTLKGNWIRWIKEGRRWRQEVSCPQCGRIMTAKGGNTRFTCENRRCAVIEVRFSKSGDAEILVDAVKHRNRKHKKLGERPLGVCLFLSASPASTEGKGERTH